MSVRVARKLCAAAVLGALPLATLGFVGDLPDARETAQEVAQPARLFWDNVEKALPLPNGLALGYLSDAGLHAVALRAGEVLLLDLPARTHLRLDPLDGGTLAGVRVALSDGSGLFAERPLRLSEAGQGLLSNPDSRARQVRVSLDPAASAAVTLAFFRSRQERAHLALDYAQSYPANEVVERTLEDLQTLDRDRFAFLQPLEFHEWTLKGPQRVEVTMRLPWPGEEASPWLPHLLETQLDEQPGPVFSLHSRLAVEEGTRVDACMRPMGDAIRRYIQIPEGEHRLRLRSDRELWVRLRGRSPQDYLLPSYNAAPQDLAGEAMMVAEPTPEEQRLHQLFALAQDNSREDSALLALSMLQEPGHLATFSQARLADELAGRHSFFRPLLPAGLEAPAALRHGWFAAPRWEPRHAELQLGPQGRWNADPHYSFERSLLPLSWQQLAQGAFVPVAEAPQLYRLPPRPADSALRLALDLAGQPEGGQLWVQWDEQPPQQLQFDGQARTLGRRIQGPAGLALEPLARLAGQEATTSGVFAQYRVPGALLETAQVELPLPVAVQRVRIWADGALQGTPLAVSYRAGRTFQLPESSYLSFRKLATAPAWDLFLKVLRGDHSLNETGVDGRPLPGAALQAQAALANHWQPLAALISARKQQFLASLSGVSERRDLLWSEAQLREALDRGRRAEEIQDWVSAVEHYSEAVRHARPASDQHREAWQARIQALLAQREVLLARQLLKGQLVQGRDSTLRLWARDQLVALYFQEQDQLALQGLWAYELDARPTRDALKALSRSLQAEGEAELALQLQLILGEAERDQELTAASAYQARWWQVFETALERLERPRRAYWRGYRAQYQGDYEAALDAWEDAGPEGKASRTALLTGARLARSLPDTEGASRSTWQALWASWSGTLPGGWQWQELREGVALQGSLQLYSPGRQRYLQGYLATAEAPLRLQVRGPLRLRFQVRPLHAAWGGAVNDWLQVSDNGELRRHAISGNRPVSGLQLVGRDGYAGAQEAYEYNLGPGLHELSLSTLQGAAWIRAELAAPRLPLRVLPPYVGQAAPQAVASDGESAVSLRRWRLFADCGELTPTAPALPDALPDPEAAEELSLAGNSLSLDSTPLGMQASLPQGEETPWERAQRLLWQAETGDLSAQQALTSLEQLYQVHPEVTAMEGLLRRARRGFGWQPLESVLESAGINPVAISGWQPESAELRVRRALLEPLDQSRVILVGDEQISMLLNSLSQRPVKIEAALEPLPLQVMQPVELVVMLNDELVKRWQLAPGQLESLSLTVPEGAQRLSVYATNPAASQYVSLQFTEERGGEWQPVTYELQRTFQVVTPREPLRLFVDGPRWLRIHERQGERERISYRAVPAGQHRLSLAPSAGNRSLMRVFELVPSPQSEPLLAILGPEPAREQPRVSIAAAADPQPLDFDDRFNLGGQEDGTWSLFASWNSRRNLAEDRVSDSEEFLEWGARYRARYGERSLWGRFDLLRRERSEGEATLGMRGLWEWRPALRPWWLGLDGKLFLQPLEGAAFEATGDDLAWSAQIDLSWNRGHILSSKSEHQVEVRAVQRWLSLDGIPEGAAGLVDQDVYTRYKDDHQNQLVLSDRYEYRPWLDAEWYVEADLGSNDGYNLFDFDYIGVQPGWRQLIGPATLDMRYRWRDYQSDDDRSSGSTRESLGVSLDGWHWWQGRDSLKLRAGFEVDPSGGDMEWRLGFDWGWGEGRGYRDYRPSELPFADWRRPQPYETLPGNRLSLDSHE